jgi:hypothetical protein
MHLDGTVLPLLAALSEAEQHALGHEILARHGSDFAASLSGEFRRSVA